MRKIIVLLLLVMPLLLIASCSNSDDNVELKEEGIISIELFRGTKGEPILILEESQYSEFIESFKQLEYSVYEKQIQNSGNDMIRIVYSDRTYEIDYIRTIVTKTGETLGTGYRYLYDESEFTNFIDHYLE